MFYFFKIPTFIQKIYPNYLWTIPNDTKTIYLTFDDGPTKKYTDWILKELAKYKAKATFFCEGQNVKKHAKQLNKIVKGGHQIGNHSFSHLNGWFTNTEHYINDVLKAEKEIEKFQDKAKISKLFRPAYGKIKAKQAKILQKKGYTIVMLDVISGDFDRSIKPEKSLLKILRHTKQGSVVVFHDSKKAFNTLQYILPRALKKWTEKGYNFSVIS